MYTYGCNFIKLSTSMGFLCNKNVIPLQGVRLKLRVYSVSDLPINNLKYCPLCIIVFFFNKFFTNICLLQFSLRVFQKWKIFKNLILY